MEIAFQLPNRVITRFLSESIRSNNDERSTIVYAGTQDGQILKLVQKKKGEKFRLIAAWNLEENENEKFAVRNLVFAQVRLFSLRSKRTFFGVV